MLKKERGALEIHTDIYRWKDRCLGGKGVGGIIAIRLPCGSWICGPIILFSLLLIMFEILHDKV